MDSIITRIFFHNWQRKLVAALAAIVIWMFVNNSINDTVTISNVPVRIINLPPDKTIPGLLPNGVLGRRLTLTLTGSKDVVEAFARHRRGIRAEAQRGGFAIRARLTLKGNLHVFIFPAPCPAPATQIKKAITRRCG